ncbi:MAG: ATPase [Bacteroidales bacterium]|nr:ATPase [Bacteroidales bacterium]
MSSEEQRRPNNPFVVGRYVGGEYFCDREEETRFMLKQIENERDMALISPRRMGKTGLVRHVFHQQVIKEKYNAFFIDIYGTRSLPEFVYLLGKEIFDRLKPRGAAIVDKFFAAIASLRLGLKLDPSSGVPMLDMSLGDIKTPLITLDEIFRYLQASDKPCVVAIDEFQTIAQYNEKNVEAVLRTCIQQYPNVHWIFAGSERHTLLNMFSNNSRPFYQSAILSSLGPLPLERYRDFCIGHFSKRGYKIDAATVDTVYRDYEGRTWYMQLIMNELYNMAKEGYEISPDHIPIALRHILQSHSEGYRATLSMISDRQKELLIAIAKDGKVQSPQSADFIRRHSLDTASSVQSALRPLLKSDLVTQVEGSYQLSDFFLSQWLKENY